MFSLLPSDIIDKPSLAQLDRATPSKQWAIGSNPAEASKDKLLITYIDNLKNNKIKEIQEILLILILHKALN